MPSSSRRTRGLVAGSFAAGTLVLTALFGAPTVGAATAADAAGHVDVASDVRYGTHFNQNGSNWSGYAASGSGFTSVTASWTEPTVTCTSRNDLMAPWVGIDGYGTSTVEQTGVQTDCASGRPVYSGWYEMYPAGPVFYSDPVSAGDHISAKVSSSGSSYTLILSDTTKGWSRTTTRSSTHARNASAEVILESPTGNYPNFGMISFTGSQANQRTLGSYFPVALDASNTHGYEDRTGSLSGGTAFSITYLRE